MVTNLSSGIITFLFNLLMMHYAGEDGVAAITIIQYSQFLLNALYMGFSQESHLSSATITEAATRNS